jgi:hypothetical protein
VGAETYKVILKHGRRFMATEVDRGAEEVSFTTNDGKSHTVKAEEVRDVMAWESGDE